MIQINRRQWLVGAASASTVRLAALAPLVFSFAACGGLGGGRADNSADAATIDMWMDQWMSAATRLPEGTLHVSRFKEPIYFLVKPIGWRPDPGHPSPLPSVDVPIGFVTDFASIPRIFWSLLRPDGAYVYAAIIHDYLYWTQSGSRSAADATFRLAMLDFEVDTATATSIYGAVRTAGWRAWNENARLKARGEKRILRTFPEDPRVSWLDWKKRSDVFAQ